MFTATGQRTDSRQASVDQMEIAGDRHAYGSAQLIHLWDGWFTVALLLMAHVFCGLILEQYGLHRSLFFNQKVA